MASQYVLEAFNADGSLNFGSGDRLGRVVGTQWTGTSDGSINVPAFAQGTGFAIAMPAAGSGVFVPRISVSGTTLSWTFDSPIYRAPSYIFYGVR
ncbi:hypothetical protein CURE108131_25185 [Cupriavidus respiraculi]|uniref:Phage tail protein n=1 Tax=Cupriavidus respiraculi TaxID=195930 RepID=A0ABN7ZEE1_9BURK|nr:hypothetical protein [Cupriavidus respiraculi]CAG9184322.1 hypothetical protein LMG21510_05068 [Cupriavidus respiraculi]